MKHFGDITKIHGNEVPITDVVIGGSPCQDLSVANGNRQGLNGERSGLFMEQVRIVKEMREEDGKVRTDKLVRPRYLVWENVPRALSSNKGEDFRIVLEEIARIKDKDAVVPRPEKWSNAGCIMADGWSVAWRILDGQFWGISYYGDDGVPTKLGTPQRRRRIVLVADFNGQSAGEILFESKGLLGDIEEKHGEGEGIAGDTEKRPGEPSYTLKIRGGREVDSLGKRAGKGALIQTELSATLGVTQDQTLIAPEHTHTHNAYCIGNGQTHQLYLQNKAGALNCMDDQQKVLVRERERAVALTRTVTTLQASNSKGMTSNQDIRNGLDKVVLEHIPN